MLRRCWPLLALILLLLPAPRAQAHPLDQLLHAQRVQIHPDRVSVAVRLIVGPLVAPRLWAELDTDGSRSLDDAEITAWCQAYAASLAGSFDTTPLVFVFEETTTFPRAYADFVGSGATELAWSAAAPLVPPAAGDHTLALAGTAYTDISVYDWSKTRGFAGIVVREATHVDGLSAAFPLRWPAELAPAEPAPATDPAPAAEPAAAAPLLARLRAPEWSLGLMLGALVSALLFGALHALQPGHGKTLVAAYLVGSRGTPGQAVLLGAVVTLTHTASVLALGLLVLLFSEVIRPEWLIPGLTVVSGALVLGLGAYLAWARARLAWAGIVPHSHATPHAHAPGDPLFHAHDGPDARGIVSLGVFGGLVPCPEALAILIVAATTDRLGLGLAMIVAFSAGLASVLIAIGLLLVLGGERVWGRLPRSGWLMRWLPVASALLVLALGALLAAQGLALILA